jgi:aspartyl aminopeptidase
VSVPAADIGIPQLAMHSAFETMGTEDLKHMIDFMKAFYEAKTDCQ